ncbi:hypothetical protein RclHR1_06010004 [Rhizophagus clarus]|uniref:HMG box domain-containing protein n=1 Tax=Rhizophagus clarus TaxID=94130 RepID=A0A2Z6RW47_9GLOM|nr:hypothetical protein RclHR1_06010004 [Rhizophagus clarus]GES96361.1 hypothetical protein GLOIN_2v1477078 [Rhizophagus clarus]
MSGNYSFFVYQGSLTGARVPFLPPPDPNVSIPFNLNIKSDKEIVFNSNYKFNIDIPTLLTNSKKSKCARTENFPKPLNPFFIYMRNKFSQPEYHYMQAKLRVKVISNLWKHEPEEVKSLFETCAKLAKKWNDEQYKEQREVNNEENGTSTLPSTSIAFLPSPSNFPPPLPSKSPVTTSPFPPNFPSYPSQNSPVTSSLSFVGFETPFLQYEYNTVLDPTGLPSNF